MRLQGFASAALALKVLFDTRERMRDTIRLRLHDGELCVRLQQVLLRALQACAQATHLCIDPSDVNSNGAS
jgi:hypothetical protein